MDGSARAWVEAARREDVRRDLDAIYAMVAEETARRRPTCLASGRCCNFARTGHLLYVTGLEAACTLIRSGRGGSGPLPNPHTTGQKIEGSGGGTILSLAQVEEARGRGDCPFLEGTSCGVHRVKPLGCRVYFCDPTAQEWQRELSERGMAMLRDVHNRHGVEYVYAEWRGLLARLVAP